MVTIATNSYPNASEGFERVGASRKQKENGWSGDKDAKHSLARGSRPYWWLPHTGILHCTLSSQLMTFFVSALTWIFLLFWQHDDLSHILYEVPFIIINHLMHLKMLTHALKAPRFSRLDLRWLHHRSICMGDDPGRHNASVWLLSPLDRAKTSYVCWMCYLLTWDWVDLLHAWNGNGQKKILRCFVLYHVEC